jgi:hypothetical protein
MDAIATQLERQKGCELVYIPPHIFPDAWPAIEPLVPTIIDRSGGRVSVMTLIQEVAAGTQHVWTVWDGNEVRALVGAEVGFAPTGLKLCTINFAAGRDSHEWIHLLSEVETWAVSIGCQKLEMWARKGWQRKLPDYRMTHILLEKDL